MKCLNIISVTLLALVAGCKPESTQPAATEPVAAEPASRTYEVHGIVRDIAPDRHTATIQHDKIPGFMMAMTMDFNVKATNELNGISPNDEINFKLVVSDDDSWIKDVRFVSHRIEQTTNGVVTIHMKMPDLKRGDALPDYELTTETGSQIHFSDFRGRVLAFTFFFTRCPLPDYCPRMSKDFAETRQLLLNTPNAPTNWEFLSISFDPDNDDPDTLTRYAKYFREDNADRWLFASVSTNVLADLAPKLDLMVKHEGSGISHNLRTVVLDPQGRIFRQLDGNEWIPQKLADAMLEAARQPAGSTPP